MISRVMLPSGWVSFEEMSRKVMHLVSPNFESSLFSSAPFARSEFFESSPCGKISIRMIFASGVLARMRSRICFTLSAISSGVLSRALSVFVKFLVPMVPMAHFG